VRLCYPFELTCLLSLGFGTLRDKFDTYTSRSNSLATSVIFLVRSTPRAYRLAVSMVHPLQSNKASACATLGSLALGELILMSGLRVVA
jgi:hypothetical protein